MQNKYMKYFLTGLLLLFIYLSLLVTLPLLKEIFLGLVLAFIFYPVYKRILKLTKKPNLSASIMLILLIILIVLPGAYLVQELVQQSFSTYQMIQGFNFENINSYVPGFAQDYVNVDTYADVVALKIRDYIVNFAPDILGSIAELLLGLFVMIFIMFYAFRDGEKWMEGIKNNLPLKDDYKFKLIDNTKKITHAVLYGYVLTALLQGFLGGLIFFIVGIDNSIFFGFLMAILAAIPFLGTPLVFVPVALIQIFTGSYISGTVILVFGFLVLTNIDNLIRPKLIGSKAKVHVALILVGVLGGLSVFGFIGIILGPLILTLLTVLVEFFLIELKE